MDKRALDYELHGADGRPSIRYDKQTSETPATPAAAAASTAGGTQQLDTPGQRLEPSRGRRDSECCAGAVAGLHVCRQE
jgi:hypothetical protein